MQQGFVKGSIQRQIIHIVSRGHAVLLRIAEIDVYDISLCAVGRSELQFRGLHGQICGCLLGGFISQAITRVPAVVNVKRVGRLKLHTPDFIISQQPEPRLHCKVCITALVRLNVYHIVEELSISGGALVPVKCFLRI